MNDLIVAFNECFEIVPANTPDLIEEVFRLRYQVIWEELHMPGYESWRFPNGQEIDEYDSRSIHCLLRHRRTMQIAGALRLILSDPDDSAKPFPIEKYAGHVFDRDKIDPSKLPRRHTAEVSRFMLAKGFRNRSTDGAHIYGPEVYNDEPDPRGRRRLPHPVLGLLVALVQLSAEQKITHWYTIMEPTLDRLLRRLSFNPVPIGPVIQYHGWRRPYLGNAHEILKKVHQKRRDMWELLTNNGTIWPAP